MRGNDDRPLHEGCDRDPRAQPPKMTRSQSPTKDTCVVACVTRDRLADAVVLIDSVRRHDAMPVMLAVLGDDGTASTFVPRDTTVVNDRDLALPDIQRFLFQYTGFELCCAIKPWLVEKAMAAGYGRVLYLDCDIHVYSSLRSIFDMLSTSAVVLTPHYLATPSRRDEPFPPYVEEVRPAGLYNAGVVGVANMASGKAFARWWRDRCRSESICDMSGGLFCDQGWLDFVPLFFDGVQTKTPVGWNVGHWNCPRLDIAEAHSGDITVNGDPLVCFHFSGFDRSKPERLSKYDKRRPVIQNPVVQRLARDYAAKLRDGRVRIPATSTRPFTSLTDGTKISPLWREAIRVGHRLLADVVDPFDVNNNPRLKQRFRKAAIDVLDSRKDWQHEGLKELGKRVQTVPGLGYLYRLARAAIEQYR